MSDINVITPPKPAEELSGMSAFLFIASFAGALATWGLFQIAETSIHEIEATLIGLASVMSFCAAAILNAINKISHKIKTTN